MAKGVTHIEGLAACEEALAALGKSLGKGVLRRVGIKALQPMAERARASAPNDPDTAASIADTIIVSTKRPKGAASASARAFAAKRGAGGSVEDARAAAKAASSGAVEIFMGPNRDPKAVQQEFGNRNHGPQPYMRPAWDSEREPAVTEIGKDLWAEIERTAARKAARDARPKS